MYVVRNSEVASGSFGYADMANGSSDPTLAHQSHGSYSNGSYSYAAQQSASTYQTDPYSPPYSGGQPRQQGAPENFGILFRELRRALGLTLPTAASFVGTRIEVIVALESGDLAALPPWPETVRVVSQLTGLAQIDPRPVLTLIHEQIVRSRAAVADAVEAAAPIVQMSAIPPVMGTPLPTMMQSWGEEPSHVSARAETKPARVPPPPLRSAGSDEQDETMAQRGMAAMKGAVQSLKSISVTGRIVALSAVLIAAGGTIAQGSAFQASLATLQTPISRLLKGAENYLIWRSSPVKDGLRWINVDDPRSRKGDKLKVNKPSA